MWLVAHITIWNQSIMMIGISDTNKNVIKQNLILFIIKRGIWGFKRKC